MLGRWKDQQGVERTGAVPWWATIASGYSLAVGRRWHLSFASILAGIAIFYLVAGAINRHLARDLLPRRRELTWQHIWHNVKDHARLRLPTGEAATRYNILQKLSYGGVVFLLIPASSLRG